MDNVIAVLVLALIIGGAVFYIIRAKKSGQKCIGCPHSKQCSSKGGCSCNSAQKTDKK